MRVLTGASFICLTIAMTTALWPQPAAAMTWDQAVRELLGQLDRPEAPGEVLFAEDFEAGSLDRWRADPGWHLADRPDRPGKCAAVTASDQDHEDLVLKEPIPIVPGHPIAVCWKARFVSGGDPLFLRVDFFDENGQTGEPYARQEQSRQAGEWTSNVLLVSDWFPPYTRAITIWFHHSPGVKTSSLLDDIRVVDLDRAARERIRREFDRYVEMATRLMAVANLPSSPVNDAWKGFITPQFINRQRAALYACSQLEPGSPEYQKALEGPAIHLQRLTDAVAALRQGTVATARLLVYRTSPFSSTMLLPRTVELPGEVAREVEITACPGEYESASLVVWAPEAVPSLRLTATDLEGPGGTIAAANVDLKWVKCWFQAGSAPHGVTQDRSRKSLVPELLLNDPTLVRVDLESQHNFLKLSFPDGSRYVPIDDPTPVPWGHHFTLAEFPVRDSPVLLPLDLPAGQNQQVWITVKVPPVAAGRYVGQIRLSAEGQQIGQVALAVQVLPFSLPVPRTHYDPLEEFTYSLYYWGELDPTGAGGIGYKYKSEEQFQAELRMMFEHGIVAPTMIWSPPMVYQDEPLFRRHLHLARQIGLGGRPLYFGDSGMIGNPTEPAALETLRENVRRTIRIATEYGFPQVYFYGLDEATGDRLRSQRPAWEAVHEAGGKVIVSGFEGQLEAVGDLLDLFNRAGNPALEQPAEWHRRGHKVWNYGHPQTPVEDPLVYRRNYGLFLWKLDFDGACTYCFMDSSGTQWNDFDDDTYRDHALAYPTVNGVVGTLALEGFREGVDDVRYATLLRQEAEKAQREGHPEAKARALKALEWLEGLDFQQVDLDEVRRALIQQILALQG